MAFENWKKSVQAALRFDRRVGASDEWKGRRGMITIWKFEFPVENKIMIEIPAGANVLSVGTQSPRKICLWAMVKTDAPIEKRVFHIRGTGQSVDDLPKFLGSVFDGLFVWHVFGDN